MNLILNENDIYDLTVTTCTIVLCNFGLFLRSFVCLSVCLWLFGWCVVVGIELLFCFGDDLVQLF